MITVVFLVLPGSVPALIVGITKLVINTLDPNSLIIVNLTIFFGKVLEFIPLNLQPYILSILLIKVILIYLLVIKYLNPGVKLRNLLKDRSKVVYDKYIKIPEFDSENNQL